MSHPGRELRRPAHAPLRSPPNRLRAVPARTVNSVSAGARPNAGRGTRTVTPVPLPTRIPDRDAPSHARAQHPGPEGCRAREPPVGEASGSSCDRFGRRRPARRAAAARIGDAGVRRRRQEAQRSERQPWIRHDDDEDHLRSHLYPTHPACLRPRGDRWEEPRDDARRGRRLVREGPVPLLGQAAEGHPRHRLPGFGGQGPACGYRQDHGRACTDAKAHAEADPEAHAEADAQAHAEADPQADAQADARSPRQSRARLPSPRVAPRSAPTPTPTPEPTPSPTPIASPSPTLDPSPSPTPTPIVTGALPGGPPPAGGRVDQAARAAPAARAVARARSPRRTHGPGHVVADGKRRDRARPRRLAPAAAASIRADARHHHEPSRQG